MIKIQPNIKSYIYNNKIKPDNNNPVLFCQEKNEQEEKKEEFDTKKALKPLVLATGAILAGFILISILMKNYSNTLNEKGVIRPPDLARNHNILDEFQFALYRALREPEGKNILGLLGVGLMSGVTLCAKSFVDGAKDIWCKKQEFDIQYDFEKKSIDAKTKAFSGKLNAQGEIYQKNENLIKSIIDNKKEPVFEKFFSFKGDKKEEKDKEIKEKTPILPIIGGLVGFLSLGYFMFKNFQKTTKNLDNFIIRMDDTKIREEINRALGEKNQKTALSQLRDIFKSTNATDTQMREILSQIKGLEQKGIDKFIQNIQKERTYIDAPSALGGFSEKIQYYCYMDEDRGHLYNWILNPENKFNKYLFLTFTSASSIGYVLKSVLQAIKDVTVKKENKKNELNYINNLVEVEINNYKAKKEAAINPLMENLKKQAQLGEKKENLKQLGDNILFEIKNGPPYIYD